MLSALQLVPGARKHSVPGRLSVVVQASSVYFLPTFGMAATVAKRALFTLMTTGAGTLDSLEQPGNAYKASRARTMGIENFFIV